MSEKLHPNLAPPPGFRYNPDILEGYDEQVQTALAEKTYQESPVPSFEGVPTLDISPVFNPSDAPDSEIYAKNTNPQELHSEIFDDAQPVDMWRIVERSKLIDGTGLVSSRILLHNRLGEVNKSSRVKHLASNDQGRMHKEDASTPYVSFSTDPENLARNVILRHGFGIKGGRDSVVARVKVDQDRVITGSKRKAPEVLLIGGVAPDEYDAAYEVSDFISQLVPEEEIITIKGDMIHRDKTLGYWAIDGQVSEISAAAGAAAGVG